MKGIRYDDALLDPSALGVIAPDVAVFCFRPMAWGIRDGLPSRRIVQRPLAACSHDVGFPFSIQNGRGLPSGRAASILLDHSGGVGGA